MKSNVCSISFQIVLHILFCDLLTIKLSDIIVSPFLQIWELEPKEIKGVMPKVMLVVYRRTKFKTQVFKCSMPNLLSSKQMVYLIYIRTVTLES